VKTWAILEPLRADCWWEHKLSPILATMYATAALSQIPLSSLGPAVVLALCALAVCASYVSILNDVTDAEDDRASGKPGRWPRESGFSAIALLAACVAGGGGFVIVWRNDPRLASAYVLCWLAFTLYSVPPLRLKTRGIWGVVADASGAHLFPTLFAVLLVFHRNRTDANAVWIGVVALWSFAAGARGILSHQLEDAVNDRTIGSRTFTCLHGTKAAARLGQLSFVVELATFATMLWLTRNALAPLFLVLYGFFSVIRWRVLGVGLRLVESEPGSRLAMTEYYIVLYPLAYLATASWQQPAALLLLASHAVLFSRQSLYMVHEVVTMVRMDRRGARAAVSELTHTDVADSGRAARAIRQASAASQQRSRSDREVRRF